MKQKTYGMLDMPREWQIMTQLALDQSVGELTDDCDWKLFQTYTFRNNLAALVTAHAETQLPTQRYNPRMIEIRLQSKMQRSLCQMQMEALASIAGEFEKAGIPMISFKGPLLAIDLYGRPEMRASCDLDILVDMENLSQACGCLESLGFREQDSIWNTTRRRRAYSERRDEEMHRIYSRGGITVELHWRICYRFAEPFSDLWERSQERTLLDQTIHILGQTDNLCYLITHGAGHGFRQLRWLLDIFELIKKEDFPIPQLYRAMKDRGVAMLLLETLLLLYRLPGFDMPDWAAETLAMERTGDGVSVRWSREADQDLRKAEQLVQAVHPLLIRNNPEEGLDGRRYRHMLPTLGKKPIFLLSLFEPRAEDIEWVNLPDRWFFLYYLVRPVHILWRLTFGRKYKRS